MSLRTSTKCRNRSLGISYRRR